MRDQLPAIPIQPVRIEEPAPLPADFLHPGISLSQIVSISMAMWKQSIIVGLVVSLLAGAFLLTRPKQYDASVTLLINPEVNDPISGKEFPVQMLANYMATQLELITSTVVLRPTVERLKIHENERVVGNLDLPEDVRRTIAERSLQERLTVDQKSFGSQLVTLYFRDSTPNGASDTANAIAEVYVSREYERRTPDSERTIALFSTQLQELKSKVDSAQRKLTDFQKRTGLISVDGNGDQTLSALGTLQADLLNAQANRRLLEASSSSVAANAAEGGGNSPTATLRARLADEESLMTQYRLTDGARNPRVIDLQAKIDATRAEIERATRSVTSVSSAELRSARQLEAQLKAAIDDQRKRVITQSALFEEGSKLKLEMESAQATYRRAFEKFEEINRSSASSYNNLKIVSLATPPTRASSRRTRTTLVLTVILGIGAGLVMPLLWGFVFRRIRCRDDVERDFGIPVIVEFNAIASTR